MSTSAVKFEYLEARRDNTILDNYHGVEVPDPYRWLEDSKSQETKDFINGQNKITTAYLRGCWLKAFIYARFDQLRKATAYTCPAKYGNKHYFYKTELNQYQSILYVQDTLDSVPRVFFNPNIESDGSFKINECKFSEDGSIFAYELSIRGTDWKKIRFINTETGIKYPEILMQVKFSRIYWTHDNLGIFYERYPHLDEMIESSDTNIVHNQKVYYHKMGTCQSEDILVIEFPENPDWLITAEVSDCGRWLFVHTVKNYGQNLYYFTELKSGKEITGKFNLTQIVHRMEAEYEYMTNDGTKAIFRTNKDASNYKLITIDLLNYEEENWTTLLPEDPDRVIRAVFPVDIDKFFVLYAQDGRDILQLHDLKTGKLIRNYPLDFGTVIEFSAEKKQSKVYYKVSTFLSPGTIYTMDVREQEDPKIYREVELYNFNPSLYETTKVFFNSKDGTQIPMFIVMKKGSKLDGSKPALLYGYGGFSSCMRPSYSELHLVFIQHFDGIYAVACVRGGGEYGRRWHEAGKLFNKQNSFDDFECAAEYLIEKGYTTSSKLAIGGESNGALLAAATMNQRPDLFRAVVGVAGTMDMLRYHKFTIGYIWTSEFGSSDNPEEFKNIIKYSPLHNIKPPKNGGQYPATFILIGAHDDRVVPSHSLKFIATLQHNIGHLPQQTNPLLARIMHNAGHGIGFTSNKSIEAYSDILIFILQSLGLRPVPQYRISEE